MTHFNVFRIVEIKAGSAQKTRQKSQYDNRQPLSRLAGRGFGNASPALLELEPVLFGSRFADQDVRPLEHLQIVVAEIAERINAPNIQNAHKAGRCGPSRRRLPASGIRAGRPFDIDRRRVL
jgi:hypothetical protein